MNPQVDEYISNLPQWQEELTVLRAIILDCQLTEEFKWRNPCYTFQKKNVAIIGGLKHFCVLSFFKGTLLADDDKLMVSPGENSNAIRSFRFTNTKQIIELEPVLKACIFEAIEVEKAGLKIHYKDVNEFELPVELIDVFKENPEFKTAFEALTPGRQKAYLLHFSSAKQSTTRLSRINNAMPRIFEGKGPGDCICGLSKKYPYCDGSHKQMKV